MHKNWEYDGRSHEEHQKDRAPELRPREVDIDDHASQLDEVIALLGREAPLQSNTTSNFFKTWDGIGPL